MIALRNKNIIDIDVIEKRKRIQKALLDLHIKYGDPGRAEELVLFENDTFQELVKNCCPKTVLAELAKKFTYKK